MTFQEPEFKGDAEFSVKATGDCCVGDYVRFERAVFTGSFRNAKFSHFEMITGKIVKDSYGREKQQHTFTVDLVSIDDTVFVNALGERVIAADGSIFRPIRIKGRNLYKNGVWRKRWPDETQRHAALSEKHQRGDKARMQREIRKSAEF